MEPADVARASWAIATLASATADPDARPEYPSRALPASEAAWDYFRRGDSTPPRLVDDGLLDFGDGVEDIVASAFWHLSRWEERPGSPRDRHGRFAAASALADPERPAVDALVERFRDATGAQRRHGFTVVLTHDVDTPRRWTGRRSVVAAAWRMKMAVKAGRRSELAAEARGLAALPGVIARRRDPNWSFSRIRQIERSHGGRSTYFLMAGHHHPVDGDGAAYDRVRARLVAELLEGGDEVGLHPSYTTSEHPARLHDEQARLEQLTGRQLASVRFHFLRLDPHRNLPELDRLGFRLDSSAGFADRPGMRAGFSFPYHPYDLGTESPLRIVELPLAVMDATLSDDRYLGLNVRQGLDRARSVLERVARAGGTVAILWHNDRFAGPYARGWDRAYDRLLGWVRERGGRLCACEDVLEDLAAMPRG
jgi:hypothetical protein